MDVFIPVKTNSKMNFSQRLEAGESWEEWIVEKLKVFNIKAYRPNQSKLYECDRSIFAKQQRDIHIKLIAPAYKRKVAEVKARRTPFRYTTIDVGSKATWDEKQFPVSYLFVIDQETKEVRVTNASKEIREKCWVVRQNKDKCYSVPRDLFISLNDWAIIFELEHYAKSLIA
ncbi:hypothetical protein C7B80_23835 [Cyanosarcina cf. burmensis CCALA 770]|nr:hypothetical protein C7B80_23835 [Cyanosarcina cf. burmensis CCALA 770]